MPVELLTAATAESISFNQLHSTCHGRIKQQLVCPACDATAQRQFQELIKSQPAGSVTQSQLSAATCSIPLPKSELPKGYEAEKDQYIIVGETELDTVEPASAKVLELSEFVPADQVDPVFFESSYYLSPQNGGQKAYALVREAMLRKKLVGVAKLVRNSREHICVLRPYGQGMILQALYWNDEVRAMAFPALPQTNEAELSIAEQLIEALAADWDPLQYSDSYRAAVMNLIRSKQQGMEVMAAAKTEHKAPVIDFASALQASLEKAKAKKVVA